MVRSIHGTYIYIYVYIHMHICMFSERALQSIQTIPIVANKWQTTPWLSSAPATARCATRKPGPRNTSLMHQGRPHHPHHPPSYHF